MNKRVLLYSALFVLGSTLVAAELMSTIHNVWQGILGVGDLSFLGIETGSAVVGFTRILIWIAVFTIFFGVLTTFGAGGGHGGHGGGAFQFLNRSQAGIVAVVLATMAAIFLPASVLLATGVGWATAIAFILIGVPVFGIAYLLWHIPFDGSADTKWTVTLKIVLCLVLLWILLAMQYHVQALSQGAV